MIRRNRHKGFVRAAWLAAFAILLQAITPLVHHPATMAMADMLSFDAGKNLCVTPGTAPTAPSDRDQAPAHKLPDCAICQAVHAIGGFVPPTAPVILVTNAPDTPPSIAASSAVPQRWSRTGQQPRAPPVSI